MSACRCVPIKLNTDSGCLPGLLHGPLFDGPSEGHRRILNFILRAVWSHRRVLSRVQGSKFTLNMALKDLPVPHPQGNVFCPVSGSLSPSISKKRLGLGPEAL